MVKQVFDIVFDFEHSTNQFVLNLDLSMYNNDHLDL